MNYNIDLHEFENDQDVGFFGKLKSGKVILNINNGVIQNIVCEKRVYTVIPKDVPDVADAVSAALDNNVLLPRLISSTKGWIGNKVIPKDAFDTKAR